MILMLIDFDELTETEIDADICIVGAGAAGFTLATQFLTRPWRVVIVEGGASFSERRMPIYAEPR